MGFELNSQAKLDALGFDFGYSYVDSDLDSFEFIDEGLLPPGRLGPSCEFGDVEGCTDYSGAWTTSSGGPMMYSPEHTYNFGVDYTFNLPSGMTLRPRINYAFVGEQWTYFTYDVDTELLPERKLWSAQITLNQYALKNKYDWSMEAYCTNLTDEEYITGGRGDHGTETYGRQRIVGFRASFKF
jgi:iron complex outermembrane receptor protein